MNEQEFFAARSWRSLCRADFEELVRLLSLSAQLWGDATHLTQQLLAPSPRVPPELSLERLHRLERFALAALFHDLAFAPWIAKGTVIAAGVDRFTVNQARCEIVRRAIAAAER
jgi:hypothetical protein